MISNETINNLKEVAAVMPEVAMEVLTERERRSGQTLFHKCDGDLLQVARLFYIAIQCGATEEQIWKMGLTENRNGETPLASHWEIEKPAFYTKKNGEIVMTGKKYPEMVHRSEAAQARYAKVLEIYGKKARERNG